MEGEKTIFNLPYQGPDDYIITASLSSQIYGGLYSLHYDIFFEEHDELYSPSNDIDAYFTNVRDNVKKRTDAGGPAMDELVTEIINARD